MKKVEIKHRLNNQLETFYPKTSADIVQYDANRTVLDVLQDLISRVEALEDAITVYNSVYYTDENTGNPITDGDSDGVVLLQSNSQLNIIDDNDNVVVDNDGSDVILLASSSAVHETDNNGNTIDDGSGDDIVLMYGDGTA